LVVPEVVEPVEPLVPPLLVDEDDDGGVLYEPEAPMPELDEGTDTEPVAVPPVEPMPEAVPEALPVELQAASAATHATVRRTFIMISTPVWTLNTCPALGARTCVQVACAALPRKLLHDLASCRRTPCGRARRA
jgi:hypothetical protein